LRHHYGDGLADFCYVTPYDLQSVKPDCIVSCPPPCGFLLTMLDRQRLPYCGDKSQLNFFLPVMVTRTGLYTECALCPFRDCDGLSFYPADVDLEVNCIFHNGWQQITAMQPDGTRYPPTLTPFHLFPLPFPFLSPSLFRRPDCTPQANERHQHVLPHQGQLLRLAGNRPRNSPLHRPEQQVVHGRAPLVRARPPSQVRRRAADADADAHTATAATDKRRARGALVRDRRRTCDGPELVFSSRGSVGNPGGS
jgi:hypothetical protein